MNGPVTGQPSDEVVRVGVWCDRRGKHESLGQSECPVFADLVGRRCFFIGVENLDVYIRALVSQT